jgi:hypothetical protein
MGAGSAVERRPWWPALYAAYRRERRSGHLQPGGGGVYQAAARLIITPAMPRAVGRGPPGVGPPGGAGHRAPPGFLWPARPRGCR